MKKLFLLSLMLFCTAYGFSQDTTISKKGLCHTLIRKGVEIYILSEPIRDYTVTGEVTDQDIAGILHSLSGDNTKTLTQAIDVLIENAHRKANKKKFEFDAIITEDGSTGTCIKFN